MSELYDKLQKPTYDHTPERRAKERLYGYRGKTKYKWQRARNKFLKTQVKENGWYECDRTNGYGCGLWIKDPEVDHIIKRSVRPDLIHELSNFQILCRKCHSKKDGGMRVID